jgi:hypothetical protein
LTGSKDPFDILAEELILIRRQVDHLQRTSLNKTEAEDFNATITGFIAQLEKVAPAMQDAMRQDLSRSVQDIRRQAVDAAQVAARSAIKESYTESIVAARHMSKAAGEARREAWRYFGGFWVWLASIGAGGAVLGLLAAFLIMGRGDAREFGQYPGIYCTSAGGQIIKQDNGSIFCAVWIKSPSQAGG